MPVINFDYHDLCSLIGKDVPKETLVSRIPLIGADMHDTVDSDEMSVEFFPDRPDLFSVEGLARSLRAFLGISKGITEYDVKRTEMTVTVDRSVDDVRPYIACAVVRGVTITDAVLRSLMEMQEKLHMTIGRKRSKVAIGIHDLDKVSPPFVYKAVDPHSVSFVPLSKTEEWDLDEILEKHEKGKDYAHLLSGSARYPVILDSEDEVLSFPPIINGSLTTVTTDTVDLFIDVTGTDLKAVKGSLNLVATALAERGGKIFSVKMAGAPMKVSPDLRPSSMTISAKDCRKFLGRRITAKSMAASLEMMGMGAVCRGDDITVSIPATRLDIMHPVDIYEDVAIGYGFERFGGEHSLTQTVGELSDSTRVSEIIRDIMIGLGYTEVTTLTIGSEKDEFELTGLPVTDFVDILNPITEDHTCLRSYLTPSLMRILVKNKHRDLPQRIFEVGDVVTDAKRQKRMCALSTHSKASFTEAKSLAESVLREMRIGYTLRTCSYRTFIDGRGAEVIADGKQIGYFGEMSPQVITDFGIDHPVMMFEMDMSPFIGSSVKGVL